MNRLPHHWQFSVDRDYNLYFSTTVSGGQGGNDIYCAKYRTAGTPSRATSALP